MPPGDLALPERGRLAREGGRHLQGSWQRSNVKTPRWGSMCVEKTRWTDGRDAAR